MKILHNTWWLAGKDVKRTWVSYPAAALGAMFAGFIATILLNGVFVIEGFGASGRTLAENANGALLDGLFLSWVPVLTINALGSRDHAARFGEDHMSRRVYFLRSLPIDVWELVASRGFIMALTAAITAPFFFVPPYLFSEPLDRLDPVQYLSFSGIWLCYALLVGGFYTFVWLSVSRRVDRWITLSLVPVLLLAPVILNFVFGVHLVERTVELSQTSGPLTGFFAIMLGVGGLFLWGLATVRWLEKRDLSA